MARHGTALDGWAPATDELLYLSPVRFVALYSSCFTNGVGGLRIVEAGESWVEVEWDKVTDAAVRAEPAWYEVLVCVLTHKCFFCVLAVLFVPDPDPARCTCLH